jgi:hypothetical protein
VALEEAAELTWVDKAQGVGAIVGGVGAILIPVAAAVIAYVLGKRQSRSHELVAARLDYYRRLAPLLNDLMCYLTFIGGWKKMSPPEVIDLKRQLDKEFHCAAPLFSEEVLVAYDAFMERCFRHFGLWRLDAKLLTSAFHRKPERSDWESDWQRFFAYPDDRPIPATELEAVRSSYDALLAALVRDVDITRARSKYTTDLVSLNAHAPQREEIGAS